MTTRRAVNLCWQLGIVLVILALWQWAWTLKPYAPWAVSDVFDPYFVSRPSDIWAQFLRLSCLQPKQAEWAMPGSAAFSACTARYENNLWVATFVTLRNTFSGFLTGVSSGVVFLVFFNTFEGARSVDRDYINASRLLGASEWQTTRTVIIPSTMAWVFASLTSAVSFALIGVIVGEFIGAEFGIGRLIIESVARGEAAGMMVAVFVLMIVGVVLSAGIQRMQAHLLRWQPQYRDR